MGEFRTPAAAALRAVTAGAPAVAAAAGRLGDGPGAGGPQLQDDALGVRAQGATGAGGAGEAAAACGEAAAAGVGEVELGGYFGSLFSCLC